MLAQSARTIIQSLRNMHDSSSEFTAALGVTATLGGDIVRASWRRCLSEYGLDRAARRPVERVTSSTIKDLRERMEDILVQASPVVEGVRRIAADTNHVILLSNADGVVVTSFADSTGSQEVSREGLNTGSLWSEQRVGTNGIGTCLISRQPITVFGGAHFNENFATFTCSAAPIFGPDGQVIAAFDISGRAVPGSGDGTSAQYFAREAASQISMMLFRKWHRDDCIVTLSAEADPMPMSAKALIATDESGCILGATQEALSYLGVPEMADIGGRYINDIWDVSFNDLRPLSKHSVRLTGPNGSNAFVTAFLPKKKSVSTPSRTATTVVEDKKASTQAPPLRALDKVVGADPLMVQNVNLCRKIIDKDIPLLILGETGVGKDTLARALHAESKRAHKPYVAVNCAAIPATLLASELFGYAPGTFTGGAKGGRTGKILASHGGTLFLDEIGDMPLDLQAHLLRVLEERTVTPLGSSETIPVDMKIVCATHRNLPDLIAMGQFRKDLYYRIRGAQIVLPSLKDRTDLPQLVASIVSDEAGPGADKITFSEQVMNLFQRYPWPGNIRELRNVLRFAASLHPGKMIEIEDLPDQILDFSRANLSHFPADPVRVIHQDPIIEEPRVEPAMPPPAPTGATLHESNEAAEHHRIVEVLRAKRWNVTEAAAQLGISRATLHRKIRRYGITSPNNQG
ncbi:MAG: sigma-54-dependent Fis family transcriptional regulator [Hyphomicrobiaceae bacterium]|nr:sigma-54-dependent Fis family transcriptional regulator [Hyphomicrobiaceae bacterium]